MVPRDNGSVRHDLPLIARHAELSVATESIEAARSGCGTALLVVGEAGIGKSRLLREARDRGERSGLITLRGRAIESGGAYRPLVEAFARPAAAFAQDPDFAGVRPTLARMLPNWISSDAVLAPMADPAAVFAEALMMLLERMAPAGAMLVLDDLQWADPDTISVLQSIVDSVETLPLVLLLAARAEPTLPPALQCLDSGHSVQRVQLIRLPRAEVRQALLQPHLPMLPPAELERLVELVDGLPLVLDELIRQMGESDSQTTQFQFSRSTLASVVQLRLTSLTTDTRLVLDALSVIGETTAEVLAATTGLSGDKLADGLRGGLASTLLIAATTPLGVTWRHQLMSDAVLDLLLPLERQDVARRAAEQLSIQAAPNDGELSRAASLYELAGFPQRAADMHVRAAHVAVSHAALDVADRHLRDAQLLTGGLSQRAVEVTTQRLETLVLAGRAADAYDSGSAVLPGVADADATRLILATARAAFAVGRLENARSLLAKVEREPDAAGSELSLLQARAALAERSASAIDVGNHAAIQARAEGRFDLACEALIIVGAAARRRNTAEAINALDQALELSRSHSLAVWEVQALAELGVIDMMTASDTVRLDQARRLATAAGMPGTVAKIDVTIAQAIIPRQGYRSAYPIIVRGVIQARQLRLTELHAQAHSHLAESLILAGVDPMYDESGSAPVNDLDTILAETQLLAERTRRPFYLGGILAARAWLDGDETAATAIENAPWAHPQELTIAPWWGFAALLCVLRGVHPEKAFGPTQLIGHHTNHAAHAYGVALWALGNKEPADDAIRTAELLLEHTPFWRHMLRTAIAPRMFQLGVDDVEGWLREADAFCADTSERHLQRRVRLALGMIGVKIPRTAAGTVPSHLARHGLTAREVDVLRLLNAGLTNAEIAQSLFISIRTVESHVSSMLQKTGTDGRSQLPQADGDSTTELPLG